MKKLLFLVGLLFILTLKINLFSIPLDSAGNNKVLWTQNFLGKVNDAKFLPDENYILVAHDSIIEIRRTIDQVLFKSTTFKKCEILSIDISKDGSFAIIGGTGGILKKIDINTLEVITDYKTGAYEVSLSPDGKMVATKYGQAIVYNTDTGERLFKIGQDPIVDSRMNHVKFTPDGNYLACDYQGGDDKHIYVYDTKTWELYASFNSNDNTPNGAEGYDFIFSPDSKLILVIGASGKPYRIWNLSDKSEIIPRSFVSGAVPIIFFKDNETLILTDYIEEKVYFLNVYNENNLKEFHLKFIGQNAEFNRNENLLLLSGKFYLVQIDKSILHIDEAIINNDILIPNPSTGLISLNINLPYYLPVIAKISNISGSELQSIPIKFCSKGENTIDLDLTFLVQGTYILTIIQKDFIKTFKIIKKG